MAKACLHYSECRLSAGLAFSSPSRIFPREEMMLNILDKQAGSIMIISAARQAPSKSGFKRPSFSCCSGIALASSRAQRHLFFSSARDMTDRRFRRGNGRRDFGSYYSPRIGIAGGSRCLMSSSARLSPYASEGRRRLARRRRRAARAGNRGIALKLAWYRSSVMKHTEPRARAISASNR